MNFAVKINRWISYLQIKSNLTKKPLFQICGVLGFWGFGVGLGPGLGLGRGDGVCPTWHWWSSMAILTMAPGPGRAAVGGDN